MPIAAPRIPIGPAEQVSTHLSAVVPRMRDRLARSGGAVAAARRAVPAEDKIVSAGLPSADFALRGRHQAILEATLDGPSGGAVAPNALQAPIPVFVLKAPADATLTAETALDQCKLSFYRYFINVGGTWAFADAAEGAFHKMTEGTYAEQMYETCRFAVEMFASLPELYELRILEIANVATAVWMRGTTGANHFIPVHYGREMGPTSAEDPSFLDEALRRLRELKPHPVSLMER